MAVITPTNGPWATYLKDPGDVLDFSIDYSAWLTAGETISASTWTVDSGITVQSTPPQQATFTNTAAVIWLSGGTNGVQYLLKNQVTTSATRIVETTIAVSVIER